VVRLAVGQAGDLLDEEHPHVRTPQTDVVRHDLCRPPDVGPVLDGHDELVVVPGADARDAVVAEQDLDAVEVDAQAAGLDEPAASPDHLVQAVGRPAPEVARPEGLDGAAEAQVVRPSA
jgi:hypothetical protein